MKLTCLVAIVVPLLCASLASAQESSSPIYACVNSKNGKPRFVAAGVACRSNENRVSWNRDSSPQLIGLTTATFDGDTGLLGFTQACQAEYPGTRFCTSEEILRTVSIPAGLSGTAWVLFSGTQNPANGLLVDVSGATATPAYMTCEGWTVAAGSQTALTVEFGSRNGSFSPQLCSEARKVACCGWPAE